MTKASVTMEAPRAVGDDADPSTPGRVVSAQSSARPAGAARGAAEAAGRGPTRRPLLLGCLPRSRTNPPPPRTPRERHPSYPFSLDRSVAPEQPRRAPQRRHLALRSRPRRLAPGCLTQSRSRSCPQPLRRAARRGLHQPRASLPSAAGRTRGPQPLPADPALSDTSPRPPPSSDHGCSPTRAAENVACLTASNFRRPRRPGCSPDLAAQRARSSI